MSEQPFTAYMVAALFGSQPGGKLMLNAVCAPSSEAAVAMSIWMFTKKLNSDEPLNGITVTPLTPEFMRAALAGKPADVLPFSIVRDPPPVHPNMQAAMDADDRNRGAPSPLPLAGLGPVKPGGADCTCQPVWSEADGGFTHQPWCLKEQRAPNGDGDAA